eukprot:jgi/Orpsp1_1/1183093/evm.model.c7180000083796.1
MKFILTIEILLLAFISSFIKAKKVESLTVDTGNKPSKTITHTVTITTTNTVTATTEESTTILNESTTIIEEPTDIPTIHDEISLNSNDTYWAGYYRIKDLNKCSEDCKKIGGHKIYYNFDDEYSNYINGVCVKSEVFLKNEIISIYQKGDNSTILCEAGIEVNDVEKCFRNSKTIKVNNLYDSNHSSENLPIHLRIQKKAKESRDKEAEKYSEDCLKKGGYEFDFNYSGRASSYIFGICIKKEEKLIVLSIYGEEHEPVESNDKDNNNDDDDDDDDDDDSDSDSDPRMLLCKKGDTVDTIDECFYYNQYHITRIPLL